MGWTFYHLHRDPKVEIDSMLEFESEDGARRTRVLEGAFVGSTYYAAVESVTHGERVVLAVIVLTERKAGDWGYKMMDETCGPYQYDCPASILDRLTEPLSPFATKWRGACRARLADREFLLGDIART